MTTPNASGGTDSLAVTGVGPGTFLLAVIGLALTAAGAISRRYARLLGRDA